MKYLLAIWVCSLFLLPAAAIAQQATDIWQPAPYKKYPFIKEDENSIEHTKQLDSFYYKLVMLKRSGKGRVSIIHIGDSHLQADGITRVVRNGSQEYFGDAGRGLVFPYQLAGSNAPLDIRSSSNTTWKSNRLTSPAKPVTTGISGYGIHSAAKNGSVNLRLKETDGRQDSFNRLIFFLSGDAGHYKLTDSSLATPMDLNGNSAPLVVTTPQMLKGFELSKTDGGDFSFYGVSLEKNDAAGVLYHTIGVNGARYDQFVQSNLFWQQLKELQGDLFIISLGTNEAQNQFVNEESFMANCDALVNKIYAMAPKACILLTTPAGSYFKNKKPNKAIQTVAFALDKYSNTHTVALWDLYKITGSLAGTPSWKKYDLLSHDGVHYNNAGYTLQGALLLEAIAAGYNGYEKNHPYKPLKKPAPPAISDIFLKPEITKKETPKALPSVLLKEVPATPARAKMPGIAVPDVLAPPKRKSNIVVEYGE